VLSEAGEKFRRLKLRTANDLMFMSKKTNLYSPVLMAGALFGAGMSARSDSVKFYESYKDVIVTVAGTPQPASVDTNYFSASITVPGLHALTLQQWTNLDVEIGLGPSQIFANILSYSSSITSTSATFAISGTRNSDGVTVKIGTATIRRSGDVLTMTSVQNKSSAVDAPSLVADNYLGLQGTVTDMPPFTIHLGQPDNSFSFDTNRNVYAKGTAQVGHSADGTELDTLVISGAADYTGPTVALIAPANLLRTTNGLLTAGLRATDTHGISDVQFSLNSTNAADFDSGTLDLSTTNVWTNVFGLLPGVNKIRARAFDFDGNVSTTAVVTVTFAVIQPITLSTNGNGGIVGLTNQQPLELGKTYKVTGVPAVSNIFTAWTGDLYSEVAAWSFVMKSNLTLTANFMPNPYIPAQGTYQGLFYETGPAGVTHQSSGYLKQTLTSSGSFTATVLSGGGSNSFSGKFSAFGLYSNTIARAGGLPPLTMRLQMNFGSPNWVSGTVSNSQWSAELTAFRAGRFSTNNPAPQLGKYTLALPGTDNSDVDPGGDGFGAVTVGSSGSLSFSGFAGDNTAAAQSTMVCENGQWPLYLRMYSGNGSMLGWLTFAATETNDITGNVSWIKLASTNSAFYRLGFTNFLAAEGSFYSSQLPLLNLSTDQVCNVLFTNGSPAANFVNDVRFVTNRVINVSSNKLSMTITNLSGIFSGAVTNPIDGRKITYKGALLQKRNVGRGEFAGTNETGRVLLEAAP
jgi:hypothetical protein